MRFMSLMMTAAFLAASGVAMADQMSAASPKPTGEMHSMKSSSMKSSSMKSSSMKSSSMKSSSMKSSSMKSSSMKNEHMKSDSSMKKSGSHMMASPKPTTKP